MNFAVLEGTLYGDTFCAGCVTDDVERAIFHMPPLCSFDEEEEAD